MKKIIATLITFLAFILINVSPVLAHAVVKPNQAGIGAFIDFSLGVPSEKDLNTIQVKLMIPKGINSVSPIVKPGWNIEVINSSEQGQVDDDGNISPLPSAIVWTNGAIPAHQKDLFMFSAQVPTKETTLDWIVEQTYADGSVMSWSLASSAQQPKDDKGNPDFSKFGPFSKTMVIDDLNSTKAAQSNEQVVANTAPKQNSPVAIIALALAALALGLQLRKR